MLPISTVILLNCGVKNGGPLFIMLFNKAEKTPDAIGTGSTFIFRGTCEVYTPSPSIISIMNTPGIMLFVGLKVNFCTLIDANNGNVPITYVTA